MNIITTFAMDLTIGWVSSLTRILFAFVGVLRLGTFNSLLLPMLLKITNTSSRVGAVDTEPYRQYAHG